MKKTDFIDTFDKDLIALYGDAVDAMETGDPNTAQDALKEAVRLLTFQKRLSDAVNYLSRSGNMPDPIDNMTYLERTALLVELALGAKSKAAYLQTHQTRHKRQKRAF